MRRDLIDLPEKYIYEKNHFNSPDELEVIFTAQEEKNLFCMRRL
jgi:hypothetical protein